mgnify:CR=1 FL=1|jgi:hypothetical protein
MKLIYPNFLKISIGRIFKVLILQLPSKTKNRVGRATLWPRLQCLNLASKFTTVSRNNSHLNLQCSATHGSRDVKEVGECSKDSSWKIITRSVKSVLRTPPALSLTDAKPIKTANQKQK